MKRVISLLTLVFLLFISITGCTESNKPEVTSQPTAAVQQQSNGQLTEKEKVEDFEYMYKILKENYPFFEVNKRMNGTDWLSKKEEFLSQVKATKDDMGFKQSLKNILAQLHNGHTNILEREYSSYVSIYGRDKDANAAWLEQLNNNKVVERYLGAGSNGSNTAQSSDNVTPNNIRTEILAEQKVAYLSIKKLNPYNIEGDMKTIKPFFNNIKDYSSLIIDIRGNGGGDSKFWSHNIVPALISRPISYKWIWAYRGGGFTESFVKRNFSNGYKSLGKIENFDKERLKNAPPELEKNFKYYYVINSTIDPKDSANFKGKIYLLVDKGVYSSSEMFAVFAKSTGFATLVGEKTGGDGIGTDPILCALPNSGFLMRFPQIMGLTQDGTCNEEHKTEPDIVISAQKNSNLTEDKCVQYVLEQFK